MSDVDFYPNSTQKLYVQKLKEQGGTKEKKHGLMVSKWTLFAHSGQC